DDAFDYAISSLFFHHLTDDQIPVVLGEMSRVSRRGIVVIDLHRDFVPFIGYKILCAAFRISPLVRQDGLLSIRKGFRPADLEAIADEMRFKSRYVEQVSPGRVVLTVGTKNS